MRVLAHLTFAAPALVFTAEGLFLVGVGSAIGCYHVTHRPPARGAGAIRFGLGALCALCLVAASALPFLVGPDAIRRPTSTARLTFAVPRPNEVFTGAPATIGVELRLDGGTIVATSSATVRPDEGHIHLFLDGRLVQMTGSLSTDIVASVGTHTLRAEFVASDHGPFHPDVTTDLTFRVQP
jgi:hypothetical protein